LTVKLSLVSSDFAFWKVGEGDPGEIYDGLADGITDTLEPHSDVSWFRGELLSCWPDLVDVLEPTERDLLDVPEDGARYVLLTLPVSMLGHLDGIVELARRYKLHGYSGVADEAF
jgi:hypothetical protein